MRLLLLELLDQIVNKHVDVKLRFSLIFESVLIFIHMLSQNGEDYAEGKSNTTTAVYTNIYDKALSEYHDQLRRYWKKQDVSRLRE